MKKLIILILTLQFSLLTSLAQQSLIADDVQEVIQDKKLKLGFSVYDFSSNIQISINGQDPFPMQSVYKLPIAISVLNQVSKGMYSLNDTIRLTPEDLPTETHSPIRDRYPNGTSLTLQEIIRYTLALSDNNGCDILIKKGNGVGKIEEYLRRHKIENIFIKNTERELQSDWNFQFQNTATPNATIDLLRKLNQNVLLPSGEVFDFLWDVMKNTTTGSIRDSLPENVTIGYKTGYSGINESGEIAAQNCVGFMEDEKGHRIAVAIYITDSQEGQAKNSIIMAQIGKILYDIFFNSENQGKPINFRIRNTEKHQIGN